jgi:hypothetical protein
MVDTNKFVTKLSNIEVAREIIRTKKTEILVTDRRKSTEFWIVILESSLKRFVEVFEGLIRKITSNGDAFTKKILDIRHKRR